MLHTPPPKPFSPFMDQRQMSMAELIDMINAAHDLTHVRRRNLASSVRRFCAALGCDPSQVPANHWHFRQRLKRFHPMSAGIKIKRWQTIKADVGFALRLAGIKSGQTRGFVPFTSDWKGFRDRLPAARLGWGLSRLGHFCSGFPC